MAKNVDPKSVGLTSRDNVIEIGKDHIALVISRKSRIIMADGKRILGKLDIIQKNLKDAKVSLMTNTAICSKTIRFLNENGIEILPMKE